MWLAVLCLDLGEGRAKSAEFGGSGQPGPTCIIAGKFGGELNLVVWWYAIQPPNKIRQNLFCGMHVRMAIPYHTMVKNIVWGKTAKFYDRQYFWLYGMSAYHSQGCVQEGAIMLYIQPRVSYRFLESGILIMRTRLGHLYMTYGLQI